MTMKKIFLYLFLLGFVSVSCYDDLGNYDYNEQLNDLKIEISKVYGVRKVDTNFVIRPVITQTNRQDKSNLRYAWTVNTLESQRRGDTLSRADSLVIRIDPEAVDFKYRYYIRFYIWDTITGAKQMFPLTLNVAKPYEGSWMILHTQEGTAKLGTVEYVGDGMLVNNDAYYQERRVRLRGKAMALGCRALDLSSMERYWGYGTVSIFYCFTDDPAESGELRQDNGFELYGNMQRIIYPQDYADFMPEVRYIGEGTGSVLLSNGYAFQGSIYGPRMYGIPPANTVSGSCNITHAFSAPVNHLLFDAEGKRFLYCNTQSNYYYSSRWGFNPNGEKIARMEPVVKAPGNVQGVDLDNIGDDKEMVYLGGGFLYGQAMFQGWQRCAIYAFAKSKSSDKSYIYEFHSYPLSERNDPEDNAPLTGFFTINTPAGVTAATPMASSFEYNRLLFYAVDNRIYRLDFASQNGTSTLIYQHPDGGAKATVLKMAREGDSDKLYDENYGHAPGRSLGIVFELPDGTGELVVLNLNGSGKVDDNGKFPAIQRHNESADGQKFGKIKDIVFI